VDEALAVSQVKRRRWSLAEKRSIVEQVLQSGARVAEIARQHGINDNLIFNWRKLYLAGRLGEVNLQSGHLLPVKVAEEGRAAPALASDSGTISIKFGKARIRIEGRANPRLA
jgi:transposase